MVRESFKTIFFAEKKCMDNETHFSRRVWKQRKNIMEVLTNRSWTQVIINSVARIRSMFCIKMRSAPFAKEDMSTEVRGGCVQFYKWSASSLAGNGMRRAITSEKNLHSSQTEFLQLFCSALLFASFLLLEEIIALDEEKNWTATEKKRLVEWVNLKGVIE